MTAVTRWVWILDSAPWGIGSTREAAEEGARAELARVSALAGHPLGDVSEGYPVRVVVEAPEGWAMDALEALALSSEETNPRSTTNARHTDP